MKQRLHKILARATSLSLRSAEKAIEAGEVTVNGHTVTKLGSSADPEHDAIKWKGKLVLKGGVKNYIVYYKPTGCLVTKSDPLGRSTIWRDLKTFQSNLNAVGRLDFESEGLLILTNDGEMINRLTHPRYKVKKKYNVKVKGFPTTESLGKLRRGITVDGVEYQPAKIEMRGKTEKNCWLAVEITEGKNRQVRNMLEAVGHMVIRLKRTAVGPIGLSGLTPGKWRYMEAGEKRRLLKKLGMIRTMRHHGVRPRIRNKH